MAAERHDGKQQRRQQGDACQNTIEAHGTTCKASNQGKDQGGQHAEEGDAANEKGCLQVHKTRGNAEERDGGGPHKQIGKDSDPDGQ